MSGEERAIRSICVAGGGIVGLSAALAFARALPGLRVWILETPEDPAALAVRLPGSLPNIHRFHSAIGVDELALVRAGAATHLLGYRFDNWSASGEPWFHVFGEHGLPAGHAAFHAVWQRARQAGRAQPFHSYTAASALAAAGKFIHPSNDPQSPLGTFLYALRLEPDRYRERLFALAGKLPREQGEIAGAERRADGGVAALLLKDGRRVEADLFVDCTGPAAAVHSLVASEFEEWSAWLPCDRLAIDEEERREPSSCDVVATTENGWVQRSPLLGRTLVVRASSSRFGGSDDGVTIRPGRRPQPWIHNVLALGDAATTVDPLEGTNLHLAQSAILRALELLPGRDCHWLELREYNRRTEQETLRVRDFIALHYLRSGRRDTPFWAALAEREPPEMLGRTLEQFERRGRLPFFEEESFDKESWLAALLGLGVMPEEPDPAALGFELERTTSAMEAMAARLAKLPERIPPYAQVLAKMKEAPARQG